MDITYNWIITEMECYSSAYGENNVVYKIHWHYEATADSYNAIIRGFTPIPVSVDTNFIPYNNLTKEIVVQWLETLNFEQIESMKTTLQNNIQEQINPTVLVLSPPWN